MALMGISWNEFRLIWPKRFLWKSLGISTSIRDRLLTSIFSNFMSHFLIKNLLRLFNFIQYLISPSFVILSLSLSRSLTLSSFWYFFKLIFIFISISWSGALGSKLLNNLSFFFKLKSLLLKFLIKLSDFFSFLVKIKQFSLNFYLFNFQG